MEKKTPQRMCVVCRQMRDKSSLVRVVKSSDGTVSVDPTGKKNGRGAYVCRNAACVEKCSKSTVLSRTFDCTVDDSVFEELTRECNE